jgi:2,3-diaminopropionate biosynthesis protein SbnA
MRSRRWLLAQVAKAAKVLRETPIVKLDDDRVELFAKLEFLNGIGSIKDRPAFWILKNAIARGEIEPRTTIVESSSGNFALALAVFCRMLELKFIPVIDPNISPLYEALLRVYCERVVKVESRDDTGGFLKTRLATVHELISDIKGSYWTNQYANPDGMAAHYHLTGGEVVRNFLSLNYVFLGVSTAGTIAGVSKRLKEAYPSVQIVAVDAEGSVIFGQQPGRRWIPGLGSSIVPPLLSHAYFHETIIVPETSTIEGCHELLSRHNLFVGGSSGAAYSAIRNYFSGSVYRPRPQVLFLCCDRGTGYLNNVFNSNWCAWRSGSTSEIVQAATAR